MPSIERFEEIEAWKRAREARSQLYVALDQGFITAEDFQWTYDHFNQTGRMIGGFMNYLRQSDLRGKKFT